MEKLNVIQLALKGFKMDEIKELVQMQKDIESQYEPEGNPEGNPEGTSEGDPEDNSKDKEIEELKKQIKDLQDMKSREDVSGHDDENSLDDIFRKFM